MTDNTTAIGDVITSLVSTLDAAITDPVYDGCPAVGDSYPSDLSYLVIGGTLDPEDSAADMEQEFYGLGLKTRREELYVHCMAVGRAARIPAAREKAIAMIEEVGDHLPISPTSNTYNALVASVDRMTAANSQAGATVHIEFTILVKARLLPGS